MDTRQHWSKLVLGGAVAWLTFAGLALVQLWPIVPVSSAQWILFVLLAPLAYVIAEGLFGWLFSEKHGKEISRGKFSPTRVLVALPIIPGVFFLSWWLARLFK